MLLRQVALVAENIPDISTSQLAAVAAALQKQATRDFGPLWQVDATVDAFPSLDDVPVGYWPIIVKADIGDPDALGFHLDPNGQPMALVEATPQWPLSASHECLEMLADPTGFRLVAGPSPMPGQGRVEYLVEVADPCEDPSFAYTVNGVLVSDFVTPAFFDPVDGGGVKYDFAGKIAQPRQVLAGGYITWHDPTTDQWWQLRRFGDDQFVDLGVLERGSQSLRGMIDRVTRPPDRVQGVVDADPRLQALPRPGLANAPATRARATGWRDFVGRLTAAMPPARAGLPPAPSIFARDSITAASGRQYRILATTERDAEDPPVLALAPNARIALAARAVPGGDDFNGTARKAAKLSVADADAEDFATVADLIASLPADADMVDQQISTDAASGRVPDENRNVRLRAFLYAASREKDNDFHLIVGRDPADPPTYMTAEVSGLPPTPAPAFTTLQTVRATYKSFFGDKLPQETYDFYDPPIPIQIEGSVFWDASHAHGGRPGPPSLRPDMPVIWEIHPVANIVFEPE